MFSFPTAEPKRSADAAVMLVSEYVEKICGIAYTTVYDQPSWSYGLVRHNCYTQTAGHEVAHMYGAAHDRANAGNPPEDGTAYGYWIPNSNYRTIMA